MEKLFIDADTLYGQSLLLARTVKDSEYRPTVIIALWRGGTPVGVVVDEAFRYWGMRARSYPLLVSAYRGSSRNERASVFGVGPVLDAIEKTDRVLIVDDVYDTGLSAERVRALFQDRAAEVRVATVYDKPQNHTGLPGPDFTVETTDAWIVFPHELEELTVEEIEKKGNAWPRLLN